MSRIARLAAAAALVGSAFSLVPVAHAQERLICRRDRYYYFNDMVVIVPEFYRC